MKQKRNRGFTLAELLIVVAIIGILAGVSFIAIYNYQRSMHQLEYDGFAKEIFIAAQNHLTMADSQGLVKNSSNPGTPADGYTDLVSKESKSDVYYFVVPGDSESILSLMLPRFSIDETVRGGSYMIIYQRSTATVLDVFYSPPTGRYSHRYGLDNYNKLINLRGEENKNARRNVNGDGFDGAIVGWYGGDSGIPRAHFETPSLVVENAEKLKVIVNNPKENTEEDVVSNLILKLYIKGVTSTNEVAITLFTNNLPGTSHSIKMSTDKRTFEIVLDEVTGNYTNHFAQMFPTLLPGEDLEVWAVASSNSALSNIAPIKAEDNLVITNSLFADPDDDLTNSDIEGSNVSGGMAGIANIRHLENLHQNVSSYSPDKQALNGKKVTINKAVQISDLSWKEFKDNTDGEDTRISYGGSEAEKTEKGCYYPVSPNYQLNYDGQKNKVFDVSVNIASDAGMFGKINVSGSSVSNIELIDFTIKGTGTTNAGALAGTVSNCTITNVLAHNSSSGTMVNVEAGGSAGGLIGSASGTTVTKSAAALIVNGGAEAGGLIGKLSDNGSVTKSYAGGHTENGQYSNTKFNVTGSTAGGLIGTMTGGTVNTCYSTCSASGTTAGGFVGVGSGGSISNSYCTGLVLKSSDSVDRHGAFAGELSASVSNCQYFDIINEHGDAANGFMSLTPLGGNGTNPNITAFDTSAEEYEKFCGSNWDSATPYDNILNGYYSGKFNLRTVAQIGKDPKTKTTDMSSYVSTHYGDWPAPEAFVVNEGSSSGTQISQHNP